MVSQIDMNAITDGTSNTIAFAECPPVEHPAIPGYFDWGWGLRGGTDLDSIGLMRARIGAIA